MPVAEAQVETEKGVLTKSAPDILEYGNWNHGFVRNGVLYKNNKRRIV
jgi:hypothetical protein